MSPADYTATVVSQFTEWAKHPSQVNMSLGQLALLVLAVMVIAGGWSLILHDLKGEI